MGAKAVRKKLGLSRVEYHNSMLAAMRRARSVLKLHGIPQAGVKEKKIIAIFAKLYFNEVITGDYHEWLYGKYKSGALSKIVSTVGKKYAVRKKRRKDYVGFLRSPYWAKVRKEVIKRDGGKCKRCGSKDEIHVHHKTYINHGNELENLGDLVCLCKLCHNSLHRGEWNL